MNKADKSAVKAGGIFGLLGAVAVAPVATPAVWAALAYGTYHVAKTAYRNAKLKESSNGKAAVEDSWFF